MLPASLTPQRVRLPKAQPARLSAPTPIAPRPRRLRRVGNVLLLTLPFAEVA